MVAGSFFHPEACRLPYATATRLVLFFVFAARQQTPLQNNDNQAGIIWKLWQLVSGSWWQSVSRSWWHPEAGGSRNATTGISIHCCHQVDFFCGKATGVTTKETTIKHVSSGSCGRWLLEAGGGQCPEGGGIRMLVAVGMPPLPWLGWLFSFFAHQSRPVTICCHCQVDYWFFVFCGNATDATATMVIARFFQGTPLLLLLVDCSFFAPESMWVVVAWLIVFVVFLAKQQATTKNHGHCCMLPPGWLCFFLMEWHCGQVSAPCSMQFAAWPMPTVQWGKITAG